MKKLIFLIMMFSTFLIAQDKTIIEFDELTVPATGDYVALWDASGQKTMRLSIANLDASGLVGSDLDLTLDYVWTGAHNFTGSLQIPSTVSSSLSNNIGFNSGLFSYLYDDTIRVVANRAWVLQQIADSGYAIDSNQYVQKDGNNTLTGDNTHSGTETFSYRIALGSGSNSGEALIPEYSSTNKPSDIHRMFWYQSAQNKIVVNENGVEHAFLDSTRVVSLMQTGSYLPISGTLTGITSSLTWSSGDLSPKNLILEEGLPGTDGEIMWNRNLATIAHGVYFQDSGTDYYSPTDDAVREIIKVEAVEYTAPSTSTANEVTVDFTDNSTFQTIFGASDTKEITFTNMTIGENASFIINDYTGDPVTTSSGSWTIYYPQQATPSCNDGAQYTWFARCVDDNEIWITVDWR